MITCYSCFILNRIYYDVITKAQTIAGDIPILKSAFLLEINDYRIQRKIIFPSNLLFQNPMESVIKTQ